MNYFIYTLHNFKSLLIVYKNNSSDFIIVEIKQRPVN